MVNAFFLNHPSNTISSCSCLSGGSKSDFETFKWPSKFQVGTSFKELGSFFLLSVGKAAGFIRSSWVPKGSPPDGAFSSVLG